MRRAVITRDGKNRVGGHSGELPRELYRTDETPPEGFENQNNTHHATAETVKQSKPLYFAANETAASEACKEVIEQEDEEDEYSDDADQMSKSPAKSNPLGVTQQTSTNKGGVTRFESNTSKQFKKGQELDAQEVMAQRPQPDQQALQESAPMAELEKLVVSLNHQAMASLKTDQFTAAKNLLLRAENNLL